jgi:hypothetical protein
MSQAIDLLRPKQQHRRTWYKKMVKCFPNVETYVIVMTEFLKQDCRNTNQSYRSLASHLPATWREHILSDPCTAVNETSVNETLQRYIKTYFSNPTTRWNTELQTQAAGLKKYQKF